MDDFDESTFPDSLPTGDPWAYDVTWFQLEPEDSYVTRSKAATLICRAASALKVYFKCNGRVVPSKKQLFQNFTHSNTGSPITEVQLNVTREEVQEYDGTDKYRCECVAWNKRGEKRSQSAVVQVAYLKKHFEQSPYSKNIEIESQTELRCIPPDGVPHTVISWLRDGRIIDPKRDANYILTADGHLLIAQTRLSDMGNYSCVAENIASRRVSEPALLTVYVNGGWSPWSTWGECQGPCGRGMQKRVRMCNSPAPLNGGRPCSGPSTQKQECNFPCPPTDGRWSSWSSYSSCGPDCKHHRRRTCSNPPPTNGGRLCSGKDTMTANCTGGLCKEPGNAHISMEPASHPSDQAARAVAETDIALYIGLGVAIVFFTIVAFIVIRLMRRKGRDHVMYDVAPSDYPPGYFPDPMKKLGMQPDLTVSTSGSHNPMGLPLCYEHTYPGAGGDIKDSSSAILDQSEHHYDVPYLHLQASAVSSDVAGTVANALASPPALEEHSLHVIQHNIGKASMATSLEQLPGSISSESVSSVSSFTPSGTSRPNSMLYDTDSPDRTGGGGGPREDSSGTVVDVGSNLFRDSIISTSPLLEGLDPECVAWAAANSSGCRVTLKDAAINLTVPEGALSKSEELYVALLTEEKNRPPLNDGQTLLSPVISCGPRKIHLNKPAILSFQHCAALKYGGWSISLYHQDPSHHNSLLSNSSSGSSSSDNNSSAWKKLATVGEETNQTPVFIQLDSNQVFLVSDSLEKFAFIGESEAGKKAVKTLRLAAFAPAQVNNPSAAGLEYSIRIYILDDTIAALERVMSQEKRLGGKVLDKPRTLLFQDGGENLCISLEDVGSGWRCKSQGSYQELPFNQVWSCRQSDLHCSFTLEKTERRTSAICFRLLAYQHGVHLQRQTFRIRTEIGSMKLRGNQTVGIVNSSPEISMGPLRSSTVTTSSGCSSLTTLEPGSPLFRLPQTLKRKLCQRLDQPHPTGKDWRLLAQKLGVDRYINFLSMKPSPTEHILDLWDVKNRKPEAITDLLNALRLMERPDAVAILEKEMGPWI